MRHPIPIDIAEWPERVSAGALTAQPGVRNAKGLASCTVIIRQGAAIHKFNAAAVFVVPRCAVMPIGEREK